MIIVEISFLFSVVIEHLKFFFKDIRASENFIVFMFEGTKAIKYLGRNYLIIKLNYIKLFNNLTMHKIFKMSK